MQTQIQKLVRDTEGAGFVEYIILIGLIALACIAAYTTFGTDVQQKVQQQGTAVTGIGN